MPLQTTALGDDAPARPRDRLPTSAVLCPLSRTLQGPVARLIGERVRVLVTEGEVRISHAGLEVACHARSAGRRGRIVDRAHFEGVAGADGRAVRKPRTGEEAVDASGADPVTPPALLRPLAEYEAVAGGSW